MNPFVLSTLFFVGGCSHVQENKLKSQESENIVQEEKKVIHKKLLEWNKNQKIKLLNHQLIPIDFLQKNKDQKGLLVHHYLGTGKTFLAIGFAENYPDKNVVLLVPRFLIGHWKKNLSAYGVKNASRYKIISHSNPNDVIKMNLNNTIMIIDESHRLINKINEADPKVSELYSELYQKVRSSYKILSLTGTPIYGDVSDMAYQMNLVSGKNLLPFNRMELRKNYTEIEQNKSFFRGHLIESNTLASTLPLITSTAAFICSIEPMTTIAAIGGSIAVPYLIKSTYPMDEMYFREFDIKKIKDMSRQYISYYDFDLADRSDYPEKEIHYMDVDYNTHQLRLLMRFADSALKSEELADMANDLSESKNKYYLELNSSKIQDALKRIPGSGREIGNFIFKESASITYPQKFMEIYDIMQETDGPIVVYSHFYKNGILRFKEYLDHKDQKGQYAILDPDLPTDKYEKIVNDYNSGKIKYLLIHPEITEGISLKGTSQLHILEPAYNQAAQEQIIGRVVRYKSHIHLPKEKQIVNIYVWQQNIKNLDTEHMKVLRENWHEHFSEVNYYGPRSTIDKNNDIKLVPPDQKANELRQRTSKGSDELSSLSKQQSIESHYEKRD